MLRLGIDEREEEDAVTTLQGLPFVINKDLLNQYGRRFSVRLDEQGFPVVTTER